MVQLLLKANNNNFGYNSPHQKKNEKLKNIFNSTVFSKHVENLTNSDYVISRIKSYGYVPVNNKNVSLQTLKELIDNNGPAIVSIMHSGIGGHAIIVDKLDYIGLIKAYDYPMCVLCDNDFAREIPFQMYGYVLKSKNTINFILTQLIQAVFKCRFLGKTVLCAASDDVNTMEPHLFIINKCFYFSYH